MGSNPIHPGEHLAEILGELKISGSGLARPIGVPATPDPGHTPRASIRYGRHRAPHRTGLGHDAGVLAEPPADSRP